MKNLYIFLVLTILTACNSNPNTTPNCNAHVFTPIETENELILRNNCDLFSYSVNVLRIRVGTMFIPDMLGGEWKLVTKSSNTKIPLIEYTTIIFYKKPGQKVYERYYTINSTKYVH